MSEISRDMNTSGETKTGPDLFKYYIRGVAELLSGDDFPPSSVDCQLAGAGNGVVKGDSLCHEKDRPVGFGSLFCNAAGDGLSGFEKARLRTMLRQCVGALKQEVDEISDPVFAMNRLRRLLVPTKHIARYQDANCKDETENRAHKRLKAPSSLSSGSEPLIVSPVSCNLTGQKGVAPGESLTRCCNKGCTKFSRMDNHTQKSNPDESKLLCGDCFKQANKVPNHTDMNESFLGSSSRDDKENGEVNDALQVLLVNRGPMVVQKMEKHSAELSATIGHMQEQIEELLDLVISSCRPMTHAEKHQLRRLIQKLPQKNMDRVVEIIRRGESSDKRSNDDITIDLQHEDHLTLWRIYFYVKAVENAQKLL